MTLGQVNVLLDEYRDRYGIKNKRYITKVLFDAPMGIEGYFDMVELMEGNYTLHLNPRFHLYKESYIKFILFHEFTHFFDFFDCPYDSKEKLFSFMNAYSEYHACRVTLSRSIEQLTLYKQLSALKRVDVEKIQIPGPYREISIRHLLEMTLGQAKYLIDKFFSDYQINDFASGFRVLMYLYGYISLFDYDELLVVQTLAFIGIKDTKFVDIYKALKAKDFDTVLSIHKEIAESAILIYLRAAFRKFYPLDVLSNEELENITSENYRDYIKILDDRMREKGYAPSTEAEEDTPEQAAYQSFDMSIREDLSRFFRIIQ